MIRTGIAVAVGVLTIGVLAPAGSASPAPAAPTAQQAAAERPGDVVEVPLGRRSARAVRDYWTPARMRAAVPLELGPDGRRITPGRAGATTDRTAERGRTRVPRTAGKLFFRDGPLDLVCTAAAIRTRKRTQVITAGHCVHTGPNVTPILDRPHFYSHFVFVPRYQRGRAPMGRWVASKAWVFNGWVERESFRYDQAILQFRRRNGRPLVNVTGGNTVVWSKPVRQRGVRIWGWPAEAPYNGESAKYCQGRTVRMRRDSAMRQCPLTGGASGGPWLMRKGRTANTGRIYAVTSRRLLDRPVVLARPNPREIRRMIRAANR